MIWNWVQWYLPLRSRDTTCTGRRASPQESLAYLQSERAEYVSTLLDRAIQRLRLRNLLPS
ncbi:hypothetical protein Tco_0372126, partial [Tanacetum coccineum]